MIVANVRCVAPDYMGQDWGGPIGLVIASRVPDELEKRVAQTPRGKIPDAGHLIQEDDPEACVTTRTGSASRRRS